jgi:hypothetical protein
VSPAEKRDAIGTAALLIAVIGWGWVLLQAVAHGAVWWTS